MVDLSVKIKQEENSYPIIIKNENITDLTEKILSYIKDKKYLVIISEKVEKIYGKKTQYP